VATLGRPSGGTADTDLDGVVVATRLHPCAGVVAAPTQIEDDGPKQAERVPYLDVVALGLTGAPPGAGREFRTPDRFDFGEAGVVSPDDPGEGVAEGAGVCPGRGGRRGGMAPIGAACRVASGSVVGFGP
jgi:hypothetical protein